MSRWALASNDSGRNIPRSCRELRSDLVGTLVGVAIGRLAVASGRVGRSFGGVGVGGVGTSGVGTGNGSGRCKSGEDESRDDFELHVVCFLL